MRVNRTQLADVIGKTDKTVQVWLDEGMPRVSTAGQSGDSVYDTAEVIRWMIAREIGSVGEDGTVIVLEAERARLTKEQADKAAMVNEMMRGDTVKISVVAQIISTVIVNAKTRFLSIPTKAAPLLLGCKTMPQAREVLERFINEALNDLSTLSAANMAGDSAIVAAAADLDSEPVGGRAPKVVTRKQRGAGPVVDGAG